MTHGVDTPAEVACHALTVLLEMMMKTHALFVW